MCLNKLLIHHTNYTYNLLAAAHSILTCVRTTNISELIYGFPEDLRSALKWQWINLSADNETLERAKEFWMLFNRMIYIDGLPAARTSYADVKVIGFEKTGWTDIILLCKTVDIIMIGEWIFGQQQQTTDWYVFDELD